MKEAFTKAVICLDDDLGITYRLCQIEYTVRDDDTYAWKFIPDYSVIDLLSSDIFQGIPGLNLDLRKSEYVRENVMPVFISERSPSKNREDLWKLLEEAGMDYYDPLEWLLRTTTRYSGDALYVRPVENFEKEILIDDINFLGNRSSIMTKKILQLICGGCRIKFTDCEINDTNRKVIYTVLVSLYRKEKSYVDGKRREGIDKACLNGKFKGRKRMKLDPLKLLEVMSMYRDGLITEVQGMQKLNISRSTFERRYKEFSMRQ